MRKEERFWKKYSEPDSPKADENLISPYNLYTVNQMSDWGFILIYCQILRTITKAFRAVSKENKDFHLGTEGCVHIIVI